MIDLFRTAQARERLQKFDAEQEKRREERFIEDVQMILRYPEGRRALFDVLSFCGVYRSIMSEQSNQVFYLEGRRSVGLYLIQAIQQANMSALQQMQMEHYSEQKSQAAQRERVAEEIKANEPK